MKRPLLFQNQPVHELSQGSSQVLVSSEHGARILTWRKESRPIITWPEDADWNKILKVRGGNPILFPFVARHFVDGKNELWRDASGVVRPMPQHGFARDARFAVIDNQDDDELRMRLTDSDTTQANYPFRFQFDVVVALRANSRLEVRFETTNTGEHPLPYYAGHHFYFSIPHGERADWKLHLPSEAWGRQAGDGSIVREPATIVDFTLNDPALIDRFQIAPTERRITLRHAAADRGLSLELDHPNSVPWYAVTTWTEKPDSDFYCIEPWLGLPNAIHHGEGLRWVAPGAVETATLVLDASKW